MSKLSVHSFMHKKRGIAEMVRTMHIQQYYEKD